MDNKIDVATCSDHDRKIARRFYERYIRNSDGLNYRGEKCPAWDELTLAVQSHWCAVAIDAQEAAQLGDLVVHPE